MCKSTLKFTIGFSLCLIAGPSDAQTSDDGFVRLVDEASLDGWRGSTADWTVRDHTLIGRTDGSLKSNRFIVADIEPVRNFEMRVDVWVSPGGNSGLQYRSEERPDLGPHVVTGYQCDVVANKAEYNGMLYEERGRRILAHTGEKVVIDSVGQPWLVGSFPVPTFAPGQWHHYRVLVEGNRHRHWVDGKPTVDVIDLDEANRQLEGVIGVQVHVGPEMEIRYRNFSLKRLADDLPLIGERDAPIPEDAVKVVPQGGWKRAGERDKNARLVPANLGRVKHLHRAGNVLLSGQPTPEELELMAADGIATVVTLRTAGEIDWDEREIVESAGMRYVELPFRDPADLTDNVFDECRELLCGVTNSNGVCLHCASANRVGAVWLVHRVLDGRMAIAQARDEAAKVGLRSEVYEEKALDYLKRKGRR
jgi:protein tyrosine phosphatase (PTP) superfamily phosphohydrolase (DUF442 family)